MLQKLHQVFQRHGFPVAQPVLTRPGDELFKQPGIGSLCMLSLPPLMPEVLEEIFDESFHKANVNAFSAKTRLCSSAKAGCKTNSLEHYFAAAAADLAGSALLVGSGITCESIPILAQMK